MQVWVPVPWGASLLREKTKKKQIIDIAVVNCAIEIYQKTVIL